MSASLAGNEYAKRILDRALAEAKTPDQFRVDVKIYYHTHNGAKFHFDLGPGNVKTVAFINYKYVTDDKREIDQLELVADKPGTFVYTMPDSDVAHIMQLELAEEAKRDIMKTAAAKAGDSNQNFDPNVPVVPVAQHVPMQVQMTQHYIPPNTGMQNSLGGTVAADLTSAVQMTTAAMQTQPPSASAAAIARLEALAAGAASAQ